MFGSIFILAINIAISILAMLLVFLIIDIRSKRILERGEKRRLIDREIAKKFIPINNKTELKLQSMLNKANVKMAAYDFLTQILINAVVISVAVFIISLFIFELSMAIIITFAVLGVSIYFPISNLISKIKTLELKQTLVFPRYIKVVLTLLRTNTTFEAIKQSVEYAPEAIKPHAQRLVLEISQYPASYDPYENFANNLNVKQSKQFMSLLYQTKNLSKETSIEFMERLKEMSNVLEKEASKKLSLAEQKSMQKYNYGMFALFAIIPISFLVAVLIDSIAGMNL